MAARVEAEYDVVVAGGGAAGVGAAVGAAKAGARVLLAEKYGFLGGADPGCPAAGDDDVVFRFHPCRHQVRQSRK